MAFWVALDTVLTRKEGVVHDNAYRYAGGWGSAGSLRNICTFRNIRTIRTTPNPANVRTARSRYASLGRFGSVRAQNHS